MPLESSLTRRPPALTGIKPLQPLKSNHPRPVVISTDMEPDDYAAMLVATTLFSAQQMPLVGTSFMHTPIKKKLARRLLDTQRLNNIPVLKGVGGTKESYVKIPSTSVALAYEQEGVGILEQGVLGQLLTQPHSYDHFVNGLLTFLSATKTPIDLVYLTHMSDADQAFQVAPELTDRIAMQHAVGGWKKVGEEFRTSFNWNLDPHAVNRVMALNLPTILWSVGEIYSQFPGGVSRQTAPGVISAIETAAKDHQAVRDFIRTTENWNRFWRQTMGVPLGSTDSLRHDFIPADPLGVLSVAYSADLIQETEPVKIFIDTNDLSPRGYRVEVTQDSTSNIQWVTKINTKRFFEILEEVFLSLPRVVASRHP